MVTELEGEHRINMFPRAVLTTNNKCFQQYPKLLLHRFKNLQNVSMATNAGSEKYDNENPQNLPHLPVPDLQVTLTKYLKTVKPFLNDDEYKCTEEVVRDFSGPRGPGKILQEYLLKRSETHRNWLEQWWLDTAYMSYRDPVPIFSSPGQVMPFTRFKTQNDRVDYAAKLIVGAISFKQLIDRKDIPVEKMGTAELDMTQYEKIIGTCRIPDSPKDKLIYNANSTHIIVAHNNHFFKVNVMTDNGIPLSKKELLNQLQYCLTHSSQSGSGVGILTSENRDTWANAYQELIQDPQNRESVREIQKSLFLVCLDKSSIPSTDSRLTNALKQSIHGGGSELNSGNRWFDKTLQFILSPSGETGLNYEHSPSEGGPVAVLMDFLHNYIVKDLHKGVPDSGKCIDPIRLEFNLNNKLLDAISNAAKNINKLADNLDMTCFKYEKYGKEFVKSQKISPDSYIQIAIQSAFYKIHRKPGAHYESAATRMYVGGRTETIRSCSTESIEFAQKLLEPKLDVGEKVKALTNAIVGHKKYATDAVRGFGVDRHMLGLRLAAADLKMKVPEIFEDIGWKRSSHMRISTSQIALKYESLMGYGPLVREGYSCCYNPRKDDIYFSVSSFDDYPNTSSTMFKASLEWCLDEMQNILLKTQKSKI